jgi:HPt (histidine-containing phosphotransfer) domain-containing protein
MSEKPVFDKEGALDRVDQDLELYGELFEMFFSDSDSTLALMRDAIAQNDNDSLERTAHSIKGALGNLGAQRAQEVSFELELTGRNKAISQETNELLDSLSEEISSFQLEAGKLIKNS